MPTILHLLLLTIAHQVLSLYLPETILIADIGGTNSRLRLYELSSDIEAEVLSTYATPYFSKKYLNSQFNSFNEVLRQFFLDANHPTGPVMASISVAGPIKKSAAMLTNKGWIINSMEISRNYGISGVSLLNDFVASGYGLLTLQESTDCIPIQRARKEPFAPKALIGAGTGLGQCYLTATEDGKYTCYPSEGGHAEFSPHNDEEMELLNFLRNKLKGRVSVERIVSGSGLANIYEYFKWKYPDRVNPLVDEEISDLTLNGLKGHVSGRQPPYPVLAPDCVS